jgi:hypothetical protein
MKQYCVAYISFHSNELLQEIVWAGSEESAARLSSFDLEYCFPNASTSLEDAQCLAFDADCMFSVIEISP